MILNLVMPRKEFEKVLHVQVIINTHCSST